MASPTNLDQLINCVEGFLLQYRNATHATTKQSPAFLFKGRELRSSMALDTTEVTFFRGNDSRLCEGLVLKRMGKRMFSIIDKDDGTVHRRHHDQITISSQEDSSMEPQPTSSNSDIPSSSADPSVSNDIPSSSASPSVQTQSPVRSIQVPSSPSQPVRRSVRAKRLPAKYSDFHLTERSCDSILKPRV